VISKLPIARAPKERKLLIRKRTTSPKIKQLTRKRTIRAPKERKLLTRRRTIRALKERKLLTRRRTISRKIKQLIRRATK